jgi:hypothetical protein
MDDRMSSTAGSPLQLQLYSSTTQGHLTLPHYIIHTFTTLLSLFSFTLITNHKLLLTHHLFNPRLYYSSISLFLSITNIKNIFLNFTPILNIIKTSQHFLTPSENPRIPKQKFFKTKKKKHFYFFQLGKGYLV